MNNIIKHLKQIYYTRRTCYFLWSLSTDTIISLENGKYNPSIYLAHKIAVIFDSTIEKSIYI